MFNKTWKCSLFSNVVLFEASIRENICFYFIPLTGTLNICNLQEKNYNSHTGVLSNVKKEKSFCKWKWWKPPYLENNLRMVFAQNGSKESPCPCLPQEILTGEQDKREVGNKFSGKCCKKGYEDWLCLMLVNPPPSETGKTVGLAWMCPEQYPSHPAPSGALQASASSKAKSKTEFTQLGLGFMRIFTLCNLVLCATLGYLWRWGDNLAPIIKKITVQPSHVQIQTLVLQPGPFLQPPSYHFPFISNSMSCSCFPFLLFHLLILFFKAHHSPEPG